MSLCYKDKTFCASDCTRSDCYRFLERDVDGSNPTIELVETNT